MQKESKNEVVENIIIGGGVAGLAVAAAISNKTDDWLLIERGYKTQQNSITEQEFQRIKTNIPSGKKITGQYWLKEFEEDGWFSSSDNYSWGRIPMIGGRSNLWSGWAPLIQKEDLLLYTGNRLSDSESFWRNYLSIRDKFEIAERPTSFFDQSPYNSSNIELDESETFKILRKTFQKNNINLTLMPRPQHEKYNALSVFSHEIKGISSRVYEGTVIKIDNAKSHFKKIVIVKPDGTRSIIFSKRIFLAASALETVRLLADAFEDSIPQDIGEGIYDHIYVRNAVVFRVTDKNSEKFNTKLYGEPFINPDISDYRMALQISATKSDQLINSADWIGAITLIGEVPKFSHGKMKFSSLRDQTGRLVPHFSYAYDTELKTRIQKTVMWLKGMLEEADVTVLSSSAQLSRPGESLHELGGIIGSNRMYDGKVSDLDSIYICDGAGFSQFGPEHPCLAIGALAMYTANTAL